MLERINPESLQDVLSNDTKKLIRFASDCGKIAVATRSGGLQVEDIELKGYLTNGDLRIEEFARNTVPVLFPGAELLSEESKTQPQIEMLKVRDIVILDDIDGTRWFGTSEGLWSIILGEVSNGKLVTGVTIQPDLKNTSIAEANVGSFFIDANGTLFKTQTNSETDFSKVKIGVGAVNAEPDSRNQAAPIFAEIHRKSAGIISIESSGYELSLVARGFLSGYVHPGAKPWDKSAGILQIEESGGIVTGWPGREKVFDNGIIAAANQEIYTKLLEIVESHA